MAGNDKPNLSDLKARLSFRLGEQSAIQAPAPTAQSSGQQHQAASNQQWQQQQAQQPQQEWDPYGRAQVSQQQQAAQQAQWEQQQQAQQQAQWEQQQQAQQQAQWEQQQQQAQLAQQQAQQQAAQRSQAAAQQQNTAQQQNAAQQAAAAKAAQAKPSAEKGGLQDLKASFEQGESFQPISVDNSQFRGNPIITPGGAIIAIAALIFGALFAFMYTTGSQKRSLFNNMIKDAKEGYDTLKPKVNSFDKLRAAINKMDPKVVNFKEVQALGSYDITVDGSPFNTTRVLLGAQTLSPMFRYLTDSAAVKNMIDEHIRITMANKAELEALGGEGSKLSRYDYFAIVFDYSRVCSDAANKPGYTPPMGNVVGITDPQPVDGQYQVRLISNGNERKIKASNLIPVNKKEIVMSQGAGNALALYTRRLEAIKRRVAAVDYTSGMLDNLEKIAKEPSPSMFSF